MLESLELSKVGPASSLKMELAPRLNLITGDNGLGKTLLLDSAWWALTWTWPRTWGGKGLVPVDDEATIHWKERRGENAIESKVSYKTAESSWDRIRSEGSAEPIDTIEGRRRGPIVIYLRVDGGVSVNDPLRTGLNARVPFGQSAWAVKGSFQFGEREIWDGLDLGNERNRSVCEGFIRDVSRWSEQSYSADFDRLAAIVEQLAGQEDFRLIRKSQRVSMEDARDFPMVAGPAGEMPVSHAPAGLRRILGLAYIIVWSWREHKVAAKLMGQPTTNSIVVLIDEVESHLHPRWQRTILPSLLRSLGPDIQVQVLASTHSPMVLASLEPLFDSEKDAWFDLDLEDRQVVLRKRPFIRQGEVGNWLVSTAFDLKEPRSLEGEEAVTRAESLMKQKSPANDEIDAADQALRAAGLPDIDVFWVRWRLFRDRHIEAQSKIASRGLD